MSKANELKYENQLPDHKLADYIKYYWILENQEAEKTVTILPDGYFDILFSFVTGKPLKISLIGLATSPQTYLVPANSKTFAISFKLLAATYILKTNIAILLNKGSYLSEDFLDLAAVDFTNLNSFNSSVAAVMCNALKEKPTLRAQTLFHHIYETNGNITISQLSKLTLWNPRQINGYFQHNFGLTVKNYCNILRFRASFGNLYHGQLFPTNGYFDQSHFIRETRRFAGTSPKYLAINEKGRFIQLSTLTDQ